ncbi:MAG: DNA-3-methyladenine glycosylase 2 [Comamonas sp.]|nr:DNA-3-methyladenine glycosylase 2 [Comamonas sp.]
MPSLPVQKIPAALCHVQPMPAVYRLQEVLSFHQRDAEQLAEQVTLGADGLPRLRKGLDWEGQAAWLELVWEAAAPSAADPLQVRATLHLPAHQRADASTQARWAATVRRILGLAYPPEALETAHADHPLLGPLLRSQQGLHVPAAPTAWEALTWAVTGQQISVAAAVALRRRLIRAAGTPLAPDGHGDAGAAGLWTYPSAAQVAQLGPDGLRAAGYSQSKIRALLALAAEVDNGALPLEDWVQASDAGTMRAADVDTAMQQLLAVPGIGPWTVHYTLLRGLGWPDGSLHGDVAVRKALARLQGVERITEAQARDWLAPFAPWRALVAAHLWASLSAKAY